MRRLILPLVFGIVGTAILVSLGNWQVRRLAWKEDILAQIDARMTAEAVAIPAEINEEAHRFLVVEATGTIGSDELHVLASSKQTGAIYRVVSPIELTDGRRLLLDRGWVKPDQKDVARAGTAVDIIGNLHWPDERDKYTPENDVAKNVWFARDLDQMAAELGTDPYLIVLRDISEENPDVTPMPVTSTGIPNDHLQYAVTWYGLAIVWVIMTLYYLRRMRRQKKV